MNFQKFKAYKSLTTRLLSLLNVTIYKCDCLFFTFIAEEDLKGFYEDFFYTFQGEKIRWFWGPPSPSIDFKFI